MFKNTNTSVTSCDTHDFIIKKENEFFTKQLTRNNN